MGKYFKGTCAERGLPPFSSRKDGHRERHDEFSSLMIKSDERSLFIILYSMALFMDDDNCLEVTKDEVVKKLSYFNEDPIDEFSNSFDLAIKHGFITRVDNNTYRIDDRLYVYPTDEGAEQCHEAQRKWDGIE